MEQVGKLTDKVAKLSKKSSSSSKPPSSAMEFHIAIDTQARMKEKMGVFGIPHAIIVEPDGYIVWEGSPPITDRFTPCIFILTER
jgi:hypothetical protein